MTKPSPVAHRWLLLIGLALCAPPARALDPLDTGAERRRRAYRNATRRQPRLRLEIGTWHTKLSRLQHPLSGSTTWFHYEGTTVVRKVWGGRANLVELEVDGPSGHIEALSLRLYDPAARQWSLNFANSSTGIMSTPTIGEFKDGRGEFYNQEKLDGRAILVRFVISDITPTSCRFEQAFSADGGKT